MIIKLEIPNTLPEGRRASFKKGIVDALLKSATTSTPMDHTPESHELYREKGRAVGYALAEEIQKIYPK